MADRREYDKARYESNKLKRRAANKAYYEANKEKTKKRNKANYEANKRHYLEVAAIRKRRWSYGIEAAEYASLLEKQRGVCAICKKTCDGGALCVDHDHVTGRIRGLLCKRCNSALGFFNDDEELLQRAIMYLS